MYGVLQTKPESSTTERIPVLKMEMKSQTYIATCASCYILPNATTKTEIAYWNCDIGQNRVKRSKVGFIGCTSICMVIPTEIGCKYYILNVVRCDILGITLMLLCVTLVLSEYFIPVSREYQEKHSRVTE